MTQGKAFYDSSVTLQAPASVMQQLFPTDLNLPHPENDSTSYLEIFLLFCIFVLNVMYGLVYDY